MFQFAMSRKLMPFGKGLTGCRGLGMREGKKQARFPCIGLERQLYVRRAELNEMDRTGEGGQGEGSQPTVRFPPNSHHTCLGI